MFHQLPSTRFERFLDSIPRWVVYLLVAGIGGFAAFGVMSAAMGQLK